MTLFCIDRSRGANVLRRLVGKAIAPVINSDRFPTYKRAPIRQICWADLRRDLQAMVDRAAGGQGVGAKLLAGRPAGRGSGPNCWPSRGGSDPQAH